MKKRNIIIIVVILVVLCIAGLCYWSSTLPTPVAQSTYTPKLTMTIKPKITLIPTGTEISTSESVICSCRADLYNCLDFVTHTKAQSCYDYCISLHYGDVHKLDKDDNGIACEDLP